MGALSNCPSTFFSSFVFVLLPPRFIIDSDHSFALKPLHLKHTEKENVIGIHNSLQ